MTPFPENCPHCKASRAGIQDRRAHYRCKTMVDMTGQKTRVRRSVQCCAAEREQKSRLDKQGDHDATGFQA